MEEMQATVAQRCAIFGRLTALIFTFVGFQVASAVVNNSDGTANACYSPKNGKLRMNIAGCKAGKEVATTLSRSVPIYAVVDGAGNIVRGKHVVSVDHGAVANFNSPQPGWDQVTFDRNVSNCAFAAAPRTGGPPDWYVTDVYEGPLSLQPATTVLVETANSGTSQWTGFSLVVTC